MDRFLTKDIPHEDGAGVKIAGWVSEIRAFGKLNFIILRDREGEAQIIVKKGVSGEDTIKKTGELTRESVIEVEGKVKLNKEAPGGLEIIPESIEILSKAETPLPIDFSGKVDTTMDKRLDNRFMDLRNPGITAIFKIRSEICSAIRVFMGENGFIEMQTPKISEAGAEGGANLFTVDYFGKKAYLSQSQQLYKQMMLIAGFDRVYEIGPSFRAEKSHTRRHVSEFTQLDVEMSFIESEEDVLKTEENLMKHVIESVKKNCSKELDALEVELEIPKIPFPRISHAEAIKMLQKSGVDIKEGQDIGLEEEKKLGELVKKKTGSDFYFLIKFPWELEVCKFYWMRDGVTGRGADLEYMGQELTSGSQREHRYGKLVEQIKEKGLDPKDFEDYLKPFMYGAPPHGGFGMGIDRLVMYLLGLKNIREGILFPRDTDRLSP